MANSTSSALAAAVKAELGRSNDSTLITTAFVLVTLNEAQVHIVRKTPGLVDLDASDETTFTIATDDESKDISSLNPAHIRKIWILNGADTRQAGLKYVVPSEFWKKYIPINQQSASEPWKYTRQGNTIYFNCPVDSAYDGLYLRIDYTKWATALTGSTDTSELTNSDKGLKLFAKAECLDEIALSVPSVSTKALKTRLLFEKWLNEYQEYNTLQMEELYEV